MRFGTPRECACVGSRSRSKTCSRPWREPLRVCAGGGGPFRWDTWDRVSEGHAGSVNDEMLPGDTAGVAHWRRSACRSRDRPCPDDARTRLRRTARQLRWWGAARGRKPSMWRGLAPTTVDRSAKPTNALARRTTGLPVTSGNAEFYRAMAFKSWRMIGRAEARRATTLKPARENVAAVPTKMLDELLGASVSMG